MLVRKGHALRDVGADRARTNAQGKAAIGSAEKSNSLIDQRSGLRHVYLLHMTSLKLWVNDKFDRVKKS
ncbi:MAG: hypothetical protein Q9M29_01885 [Mariprofundaceae bacterium]|nr:hypothetical protein [Mariprofundaceae bacterium]